VAFESRSRNLDPDDTDRSGDIFVRELGPPPLPRPPRVYCGSKHATMVLMPRTGAAEGFRTADVIVGSRRGDRIDGEDGRDRICAGRGRDVVRSADGFSDRVDCGPGRDRLIADALDRVRRCEGRRIVRSRGRRYEG
jgi:hypothetical protein